MRSSFQRRLLLSVTTSTALLLAVVLSAQQRNAGSPPTLRGVWRVTQVTFTGPNARTITAQPGLFMFTERHFSTMRVNNDTARTNLPTPAKATDQEVAAAARAFTAFAGTYEVVGDELRTNSSVELVPNNTRSEGFPRTFNYKLDGKTLQLVQKTINNAPVTNPLTLRYERVE